MAAFRLLATLMLAGAAATAAPQASDEPVLRTPSIPEWKLLYKVDPEYPAAALQYRIRGTVKFVAVVGTDGHIEGLRLISGHRLLVQAAREAVQEWIYRPTLRGGKPIRVITQIEVDFQLDH